MNLSIYCVTKESRIAYYYITPSRNLAFDSILEANPLILKKTFMKTKCCVS